MTEDRPTVATVFGILHIIFGALGILGAAMNVLAMAVSPAGQNPVYDLVAENSLFAAYTYAGMVLGLVVSILLIAAGIGLLKVQPWARTVSIGYAIYGILMATIGTIIGLTVILPAMADQGGATAAGARIGVVIGSVTGFIYPVLVLIFMLRSDIKEAFTQRIR